ncbi:MAG: hypothetical protein JW993_20270 [Sedimentisphaerales bacterium]|nr:hypothetical protein [Sedimentisphaerales bacterium]
MARYLMLWELDRGRIAADPKERAADWTKLAEMVKKDLKGGVTKSWGAFVGEMKGYCVVEGETLDIAMMVQRYTPYVYFQTFPCVGVEQIEQMLKQLAAG